MRILVISHVAPFPAVSGGDWRTYHLVRRLAARHEVTVVAFKSGTPFAPPPFSVRVHDVSWQIPPLYQDMHSANPEVSQAAYERLLYETEEPWIVSSVASERMEETLRGLAREGFDLALIEHTNMARLLRALPPRLPKILDLVDVHTLMALRQGEEEADRREAERTCRFESWAAAGCTLCLAVSEREAKAVRTLLGVSHVRVVPNGVDTAHFIPTQGQEADAQLLFTGTMNYAAQH